MRRLPLLVCLAALPLAACHGKGTGDLAKNVEAAFDNRAQALDNLADTTSNSAEAELAREQADAMHEEGKARKKAIEEAHTNPAKVDPRVLNSVQPAGATKP